MLGLFKFEVDKETLVCAFFFKIDQILINTKCDALRTPSVVGRNTIH